MKRENIYDIYVKKFKGCFKKPLTEGEIIKYLHKEGFAKSGRPLFEGKYLPKLRGMALVGELINDPSNRMLLKKYYDIEWKDMIRRYYVFTPKTAEINHKIRKIIESFADYLENKEEILNELDKLSTMLSAYEVLFYSPFPKENKKKDPKLEIIKKLNKEYIKNSGNIFDYLFYNEKNYTHPESLMHRMQVKIQFNKVMGLLNQQIQVNKIFLNSLNNNSKHKNINRC